MLLLESTALSHCDQLPHRQLRYMGLHGRVRTACATHKQIKSGPQRNRGTLYLHEEHVKKALSRKLGLMS